MGFKPHVRIPQGFTHSRVIARMGGPIPWAIYLTLLDHRNRKTGESYPSVTTLVEAIGITRRPVQIGLRQLENNRLIRIVGSRKGGRMKSIHYIVNDWTAADMPKETAHLERPLDGNPY